MEIINWLATPEGVLSYNYGPKGVTWDYDENGDMFMTEVGIAAQASKRGTTIEYGNSSGSYRSGEFQHNNPIWSRDTINPKSASGETFNWDFWESTHVTKTVYDIEQSWRDWAGGARNGDEFLRDRDMVAISLGTKFEMAAMPTDIDVIWESVTTAIVNGSWMAIYAKTDAEYESIVADMISTAKGLGYDKCIGWIEGEAERRREAEDATRVALGQ
jgi:multiple sugar transport system substrate-binding protein/putative aldouronate transport system substrate-binding protein